MSPVVDDTYEKPDIESDSLLIMRIPLFEAIPYAAMFRLLSEARSRRLASGEKLISQGDEGDTFFIIRGGHCLVTMERAGVRHLIGRLGPGDIVGEMAILTGAKRNADVVADTDLEVIEIRGDTFDEVCCEFPEVRTFLTRLVTDRLSTALLTTDRTIGKYIINEVLGEGGCSIVYKGAHSSLKMPVAIKMLKHELAMEPHFFEAFRNEAGIIAQLDHENILKVYDVEELYRTFFIIMEYVQGESLTRMLIQRETLAVEMIVDYVIQIVAGLSHAHERGIIHRDIKPGNIIINKDNRVKIVDFGFACARGTRDSHVKGTPYYLSPEQITGEPVDERTDIYSLGIMLYEMLVGDRPCEAVDTIEILSSHLKEDVPEPRSILSDIPDELNTLVVKCTRRDPEERYRNMGQILRDIEPLAERLGLTPPLRKTAQLNMTSLFLFYRDEHQSIMQNLIKDFSRDLEKIGATLKGVNFKGVQK